MAGLVLVVLHAGCAKDNVEEARKRGAGGDSPHSGMPGLGGGLGNSTDPTDGNVIPLKLTGLGSAAELQREVAKLKDENDAATFERAFRLTFTSDKMKRGYSEASKLLSQVTETNREFAPAYRTLAYAKFNMNVTDPSEPVALYQKSVDLDPQYGEAHYAIAFMYTMIDLEKGVEHYKKAMALGVPDERNIGPNFYAQALETH
jgi:tetratricopeptide (TPR) repeat protein